MGVGVETPSGSEFFDGDHYIEFGGGNARIAGERQINGVKIILKGPDL